MSIFHCTLVLLLLFCNTAFSENNPDYYSRHDPEQDFSIYKTFAWTSERPWVEMGNLDIDPIVEQRVMDAIKTTLSDKGFIFIENRDDADIAVSFTLGARDQIEIDDHQDIISGDWRWGRGNFGQPHIEQFTEGTLAIDLYDLKRRSPVWFGSATKRLDHKEIGSISEERLKRAVEGILGGFPPND